MSAWSPHIDGKVFVVTGGAVGVGAAVVRTLLTENARCVVFLDIKEREGSALETQLNRNFGALTSKFMECDISNENQLADVFKQILDKYKRIDGVINNAAVFGEDELYLKMIDINFKATVSTTLKALDAMSIEKGGFGGTVVNISSLLALTHHSSLPVYTATKAAVLQFSNSLGASESCSKTKVRVVTVCLGPTDTAIIQKQNLANFSKDSSKSLTSRAPERQRVESAANGIVEVIKKGASGSTWIVANDTPAADITDTIKKGFEVLERVVSV